MAVYGGGIDCLLVRRIPVSFRNKEPYHSGLFLEKSPNIYICMAVYGGGIDCVLVRRIQVSFHQTTYNSTI